MYNPKVFTEKYLFLFMFILSIASVFFAVKSLLSPGFFPIHDNEQVARLYEVDKDLKAHHFPPVLAQDLGFGYDYPLFDFYPPFVYYVAEIFHIFGFSFIASIKLMVFSGFALSFLSMYLFSKLYLGRMGGLIAAISYIYVPYHAVDVYVRGAFPESWSFVFIPFVFWSFAKLSKTRKHKYAVFSALFIACFILTHNLIAMMSAIFIGSFIFYLFFLTKNKRQFINVFSSLLFGVFLSAYFWLPAILEKKYTMVDLLTTELANYNLHFVYLKQFLSSPWGYGGSVFGLSDGLSFQIGKVHIVASLIIMFYTIFFYIVKKINKVIALFAGMFCFSVFLMTFYSQFIWNILPPFWYIQFPWRFLIFSSFFSSFLIGSIISLSRNKKTKIIIFSFFAFTVIYSYKDYFQPVSYLKNVSDTDYIKKETINWDISRLSFEYVPRGISTKKSPLGNTIVDIGKSEIPKQDYQVISGAMEVKVIKSIPQTKNLLLDVKKPGILNLNTYSFPGWKIFIDRKEVKFRDNNKLKLISIFVPKGKHSLDAQFEDTLVRKIGKSLSICAMFGLILLIIINKIYEKR